MKIYFLVSNLDNHNIGVLKLSVDTEKLHDVRSALNTSKQLKKMLGAQFSTPTIQFTENDIWVKRGHRTEQDFVATIQMSCSDNEIKDEITLEETHIF